ncbi:MAG TPA: hypothetical protein VKA48_10965 [Gammaproteobacteria bacterium]|nr:hypothetical protein [Gammaproteobacteria bacterium]
MTRNNCHNRVRTRLWQGATITCAYSFDPEMDHSGCRGCFHYQHVYPGDEWAHPGKREKGGVHYTDRACEQCEGRERLVSNGAEAWCPRCDI